MWFKISDLNISTWGVTIYIESLWDWVYTADPQVGTVCVVRFGSLCQIEQVTRQIPDPGVSSVWCTLLTPQIAVYSADLPSYLLNLTQTAKPDYMHTANLWVSGVNSISNAIWD